MNASRLRITFAMVMSFMVVAGALLALGLFKNTAPAQANPGVIYVDMDAPGPAHNGLSWTTAYTDVQPALTTAISGTEIWVAEGVYYPGAAGNTAATFQLKSGVALYGGFAATETQRTQRDWVIHVTVLSGDIDRNDINSDGNFIAETWADIQGSNAYHVVTGSGTNSAVVMDGFTVAAGSAYDFSGVGGGMYNSGGSPQITNVTFSGNKAMNAAGGMYNGNSNPILTNVTFSGNGADSGGGMCNTSNSSPFLTNVMFRDNRALMYGGGMDNLNSNPRLTNVTFSGNNSTTNGGGIYNSNSNSVLTNVTFSNNGAMHGGGIFNESSSPRLTNVTFSGNQATTDGGGMYNWNGNPALTNVAFTGNRAGSGGGMYNEGGNPALTNVTFSGNLAAIYSGGGIYNHDWFLPTLVNSILWGDSPDEIYNDSGVPTITYSDVYAPTGVYPGTGNINADPQFVSPITAAAAPTTTGNYRLRANSPAIDAGNTLSVTVPTDLDGRPRVRGSAVDMGAYEFGLGLAIHKAATPNSVAPDHTITYTLHVLNTGSTDLHAVITDTLPDHVTPTGILTWTPIITTPNGIWAYTFAVTVEQSYSEPLVNVAHITTAEGASGFAVAVTNGNNIYLPIILRQ